MPTNDIRRRRNYFIKKRFQASFFVKFALLLLFEAVLIAVLFLHISKGTLTAAYKGTELTIQSTNAYFFVSFLLISLIVGVTIGITGIFVFMYLSHRIGGPLYRFEKAVEDVKKGDLSQRVNLRKTDELDELRKRMNSLLEDIDSRVSDIKNEVKTGLDLISRNEGSVERIKEILNKIKNYLEHFKTSK